MGGSLITDSAARPLKSPKHTCRLLNAPRANGSDCGAAGAMFAFAIILAFCASNSLLIIASRRAASSGNAAAISASSSSKLPSRASS